MRTRVRASLDSTCIASCNMVINFMPTPSRGHGTPIYGSLDSFLETCVPLIQIQFFNPDVAKPDVMSFRLQLEPLRCVGDAFAFLVAAVHARVRAAPNLID